MRAEENKIVMAENIQRYMDQRGITRQQLCDALDIKYTTLRDWLKGITYPRIGKVEAMANYFGCEKSDLIENKSEKPTHPEIGELSKEELEIIEDLRRLAQADQDTVRRMIKSFSISGEK